MEKRSSFFKELMAITAPVAMQSLLSSLVSASDALMLGFLDQSSLSAISLATQVAFVLSLFHIGFAGGASVLAAQYWGIRDRDTVERVLGVSLRVSVPVSAIFTVLALLAPGMLMGIFTNEPELIELGIPYLRTVSLSYFLMGVTQMYLNIMKNSGRVTRSSLYGSAAVVSNIVLNLVLIFGLLGFPAMGIRGAALATVIARLIELGLCLWENRRKQEVRMRIDRILRADRDLERRYHRLMLPVLLNYLAWGCGFTMFSVILGHMGSDAVAANSVTNIIKNILLCFCMGVGTGSGIMVGNRLGAGKLEEAKITGHRLLAAAVLFGAAAGAVILLLIPVAGRFAPSLTDQAQRYMRFMMIVSSYWVIGNSLNSTMISGIFTAGGDTRFGLICDLINMWVFIIPISALAAFVLKWPVPVVYFLLNLDEICKIPVEVHHYRKYKWIKNLTVREGPDVCGTN